MICYRSFDQQYFLKATNKIETKSRKIVCAYLSTYNILRAVFWEIWMFKDNAYFNYIFCDACHYFINDFIMHVTCIDL